MTFAELRLSEMYSKQSESVSPASTTEKKKYTIKISTDNLENEIHLSSASFKFAKASGNYVEFFYFKENKVVKDLQRITLSKFEEQISKSELNVMKTHRSYVVNLDAVEDVQGNAQGYVLSLTNTDERVPVARNHVNDFNLLMNG